MKLFSTLILCVLAGTAFAQGKSGGGFPHEMVKPVPVAPAQSKSGGGPPHALVWLKFLAAAA